MTDWVISLVTLGIVSVSLAIACFFTRIKRQICEPSSYKVEHADIEISCIALARIESPRRLLPPALGAAFFCETSREEKIYLK